MSLFMYVKDLIDVQIGETKSKYVIGCDQTVENRWACLFYDGDFLHFQL